MIDIVLFKFSGEITLLFFIIEWTYQIHHITQTYLKDQWIVSIRPKWINENIDWRREENSLIKVIGFHYEHNASRIFLSNEKENADMMIVYRWKHHRMDYLNVVSFQKNGWRIIDWISYLPIPISRRITSELMNIVSLSLHGLNRHTKDYSPLIWEEEEKETVQFSLGFFSLSLPRWSMRRRRQGMFKHLYRRIFFLSISKTDQHDDETLFDILFIDAHNFSISMSIQVKRMSIMYDQRRQISIWITSSLFIWRLGKSIDFQWDSFFSLPRQHVEVIDISLFDNLSNPSERERSHRRMSIVWGNELSLYDNRTYSNELSFQ